MKTKHPIATLAAVATLAFTNLAQAANVAPLGLELGVATLDQVKNKLAATRLEPNGTNAYSDGPMLKSDGAGLEIEGLHEIVFIFDAKQNYPAC